MYPSCANLAPPPSLPPPQAVLLSILPSHCVVYHGGGGEGGGHGGAWGGEIEGENSIELPRCIFVHLLFAILFPLILSKSNYFMFFSVK